MKIVVFSDIHGQMSNKLTQWFDKNPADLLLFAGDLQTNNIDSGIAFLDWLHRLPYINKVMVFGNHDGNYEQTIDHLINKKYNDITILTDAYITIQGIKIFGSPQSLKFGRWWFMKEDRELAEIWKKIPDDTDILLTHGPPYGVLDETFDHIRTGSASLLDKIFKLENLRYHVFGHIHEAYGIKVIGRKTFINTSILDEYYQFAHFPIIIDYDNNSLTETEENE